MEQSMQRALKTNLASMDAGGRGLEGGDSDCGQNERREPPLPRRAGDVTERRALTLRE